MAWARRKERPGLSSTELCRLAWGFAQLGALDADALAAAARAARSPADRVLVADARGLAAGARGLGQIPAGAAQLRRLRGNG